MNALLVTLLMLVAVYCFFTWLYLAYRTYRYEENWEGVTFHLGLVFVLCVGFLLIAGAQFDQLNYLKELFADSRLQ